MFIISLTYKCQLEEVDKHLDSHVTYLKREYAKGDFIVSGRKIPRTGGVILSNVKTKNELELILEKDPFYQEGIAEYEITEFIPSMLAEGFEKLKKINITSPFTVDSQGHAPFALAKLGVELTLAKSVNPARQ